jgi:hypothetical protein
LDVEAITFDPLASGIHNASGSPVRAMGGAEIDQDTAPSPNTSAAATDAAAVAPQPSIPAMKRNFE